MTDYCFNDLNLFKCTEGIYNNVLESDPLQSEEKGEEFMSVSYDPSKESSEDQKHSKHSERNLDILSEEKKESSESKNKDNYSSSDYQQVPQSDHLMPNSSFRSKGARSSRDNLISVADLNLEISEGQTERAKQQFLSENSSKHVLSNQGDDENYRDVEKSTPSGRSGKLSKT